MMYGMTHFEMGDDTTYASSGTPSADAFYSLLEANRSHFPRFQRAWDDCRGAAVEHLLAAREAVEAMSAMEQEIIHVEWVCELNKEGKPVYLMTYYFGPFWVRFARLLRVLANEGRACLEAYVYEFALVFDAVPQGRSGDDLQAIAFLNSRTKDTLQQRASGSVNLSLLLAHLQAIKQSYEFCELDTLRRVSYHRHLPHLTMEFMAFAVNTSTGELRSDLPAPRLFRPADFEEPARGNLHHESYIAFAERTLTWLTESLEEAYRIATRAVAEHAQYCVQTKDIEELTNRS